MRQFKPSPDWVVNDQFTVTPDYVSGAVLFIRKLFHAMIAHVSQQQKNASQAPATTAQNAQANMPMLNASNLQQLQQQEEALQRARRASSQSGAVASAPFGAPSPQGVPHAYGPSGLSQEKLKLPPPKKRKHSQAGPSASSAQNVSAPPAAAAKYQKAVAEAKSTAAALAGAFKCSVPECQHHLQGFATQAALDKHIEEIHLPEVENIDDPLQFALDSFAIGLETKTDGVHPGTTVGSAVANSKALASPAKQGIATPVTAGTTPLARVASQIGAKPSPAVSAQQLTPRQPPGKTLGPSPAKPSPSKDEKKEPEAEGKDLWADSAISLETLHDTFSNFQSTTLPSLGYDPFEEFLNAEMFSKDQEEDTPDSWDINLATLTPPEGGEPKEPMILSGFDGTWDDAAIEATAAWMDIPEEIQNNDDDGIKGVRIDWDLLERQNKEMMNLDNSNITIPAI